MDKCKSYSISRQILVSCLICQFLTNISVMAVGACIAIDPRKADIKGHGFIMLILSVMFLCILAVGAVGTVGEYSSILLLFAGLMVVGFLVGGITHLMVFLTSITQDNTHSLQLHLKNFDGDSSKHFTGFNETGYIKQMTCSKTLDNQNLEFNYQKETEAGPNENETKKVKSNFKESVIYIMVFDYISKIICIVSTVMLAWILW